MAKAIKTPIAQGHEVLKALTTSYMAVQFSKPQMLEIISDPLGIPIFVDGNPNFLVRSHTVGILVREKRSPTSTTLEVVKVTASAFKLGPNYQIDLPDLMKLNKNKELPSVVGVSDKKNPPQKFRELDTSGFVYFDKSTIVKMLQYKSGTEGLVFKRVRIELEKVAPHHSLTVEPYPLNTLTDGDLSGQNPSDSISLENPSDTPLKDFTTFAVGYGCPPNWPPEFINSPLINIAPDLPFSMG